MRKIISKILAKWGSWVLPTKIAIILGALGLLFAGFGLIFNLFSMLNCIQQEKKNAQIETKLNQLITLNESMSEAQEQAIITILKNIEAPITERLKKEYSQGYAMLYVENESWYFVPNLPMKTVDWTSTRIASISKDAITILMPSYIDENSHFLFQGMTAHLKRIPGYKTGYGAGPVSMVAEYLDTVNGNAVVVVGLKEGRPNQNLPINIR